VSYHAFSYKRAEVEKQLDCGLQPRQARLTTGAEALRLAAGSLLSKGFTAVAYRNWPEGPRLQSGDAWLLNSPRQDALLLSEPRLSPWGIMAWGYDP
jgi:hypothetical protein